MPVLLFSRKVRGQARHFYDLPLLAALIQASPELLGVYLGDADLTLLCAHGCASYQAELLPDTHALACFGTPTTDGPLDQQRLLGLFRGQLGHAAPLCCTDTLPTRRGHS